MAMPPNESGPPSNLGPNPSEGRDQQQGSGGRGSEEPPGGNPVHPPSLGYPQPEPQQRWGQQGYPPSGQPQGGEPNTQYLSSGASGAGGQQMGSRLSWGPGRPSPIGLGLAGVGLVLLAIASLTPQISWGGDEDVLDVLGVFGTAGAGFGLPALAPALVLVVLVGWTAVGVKPGLEWAAMLGGIGLAAITVAAALHPVIAANDIMEAANAISEGSSDGEIEVSAGVGVWLFISAALVLAVSIFMLCPPAARPMRQRAPMWQPGPYGQPQQWQ
jgi:hypothetical protein